MKSKREVDFKLPSGRSIYEITLFCSRNDIGILKYDQPKWNNAFLKMKETFRKLNKYYESLNQTVLTPIEIECSVNLLMSFAEAQNEADVFIKQLQEYYGKPLPTEKPNARPRYPLTADGEFRLREWANTVRGYEKELIKKIEFRSEIKIAFEIKKTESLEAKSRGLVAGRRFSDIASGS